MSQPTLQAAGFSAARHLFAILPPSALLDAVSQAIVIGDQNVRHRHDAAARNQSIALQSKTTISNALEPFGWKMSATTGHRHWTHLKSGTSLVVVSACGVVPNGSYEDEEGGPAICARMILNREFIRFNATLLDGAVAFVPEQLDLALPDSGNESRGLENGLCYFLLWDKYSDSVEVCLPLRCHQDRKGKYRLDVYERINIEEATGLVAPGNEGVSLPAVVETTFDIGERDP